MAERQQDHFGSPMAVGARGLATGGREKVKREEMEGGTCHNDKPGLGRGQEEGQNVYMGRKRGRARRDLPQ